MEEIVRDTAEGSAQIAEEGDQKNGVSSEHSEAEANFSDSGTDSGKANESLEAGRSADNALRRRQAEERQKKKYEADLARERNSAREEAILEVLNRKNPYTGEEMKDSRDIEEYFAMKEIEEKGGDPVGDFAKYHKERERRREAEEAKQEETRRWYEDDRRSFVSKYPEVDLQKLIDDPDFVDYAEGKVGKRPLAAIYESYMEREAKMEARAREKAAQMLANRRASPGTLSSNDSGDGYFGREEVSRMSPAEVRRNYDNIRKSMEKWK